MKGSKFSCPSGVDSSAAGSDSLDSPESSSGFLFLLRLSGEAAGGGEFVWEVPETCSDFEILSEEPALFFRFRGFALENRSFLRVISDDGSLRYISTFRQWRKRRKCLVVL